MATTTNYGWTTPDDTSLVKDGASAIRSLGSSIDTTVKNLNPETSLGDISYRSSTANTNTRLALGTAGQVLSVNSGATAPEWKTLATWSPNLTLLNAGGTAMTGATTITVNITAYDYLHIYMDGASSANASFNLSVQFNSDSGTNYRQNELIAGNNSDPAVLTRGLQTAATSLSTIVRSGNSAADVVYFHLSVLGAKNTGVKSLNYASYSGGAVTSFSKSGTGLYVGTSAITSVSFISNNGNFDAGTVYIYGG